MVDVAHDGDHRRPRLGDLVFFALPLFGRDIGRVFLFLNGLKPNSEAINSIWSKSRRWFTVTMSPSSLNASCTIWVAGTFMRSASSDTEMNSLTLTRVFSRSFSSAARAACSW